jgi:hypothetical protein
MSAPWDRLPLVIGEDSAELHRQFRASVERAFPGRVRAMVLFGFRSRWSRGPETEWDVAVFIDHFDGDDDTRLLHVFTLSFWVKGSFVSALGLPSDHEHVSPDLLASIERDGIPVPGPQGLTVEEFRYWERDEPDLHELIRGHPVRMSDARQASRRVMRANLAATVAHGGDLDAGRRWVERPRDELGGVPQDLAMENWRGLVRVLRLLEATWPGCTNYKPSSAPFLIGCRGDSLLKEAERFAELEVRRR